MAKKDTKRRAGGARQVFRTFRDKRKATTEPVAAVSELKGLWDREFGVYQPTVVKVTDHEGSILTFEIVISPDGTTDGHPHEIDLDDGASVWGDLPSTAQLVDPSSKQVLGYLLLNQNWLYENVAGDTSTRLALADGVGDPPKIPRIYSL